MFAPRLLLTFGVALVFAANALAQEKKEKPSLPTGTMAGKDWLKFPATPMASGELDRLINAELAKVGVKPAPRTSDEQFIRRVTLDVTGKMPSPSQISDFVKDADPNKRAKLIDKLLDSDGYAKHWSQYWCDVIMSRATDNRARQFVRHFDLWLVQQLKENKSWASITKDVLTASGDMKFAEPDKNGQAFFLSSRSGGDAGQELAAETSRIFLGIQIQCAQCHDHPSDVWKREQFHEFAAYFSRVRGRPLFEEKKIVGATLASLPFGEQQMPDKDNPKQTKAMRPKFLDGKAPPGAGSSDNNFKGGGGFGKGGFGKGGFGGGGGLSDTARRKALADQIVSKDDPWFAAAYVNRTWGALMGQSFYQPIDDLGPEKEATMPAVLGRLSASFRGSDYDMKAVLRVMLNSEAYQRQMRPGEAPEEHLLFAGNNPNRLPADMLFSSLTNALGTLQGGPRGFGAMMGGGFGRFFGGFENVFKQEFGFDPSAKAEDVEGTVSQALLLMNNAMINQRIKAAGPTVLGNILSTYSDDDEALRAVYMKALARRPTDRELTRVKRHISESRSRAEAYEDILWALINSTEFQTRR